MEASYFEKPPQQKQNEPGSSPYNAYLLTDEQAKVLESAWQEGASVDTDLKLTGEHLGEVFDDSDFSSVFADKDLGLVFTVESLEDFFASQDSQKVEHVGIEKNSVWVEFPDTRQTTGAEGKLVDYNVVKVFTDPVDFGTVDDSGGFFLKNIHQVAQVVEPTHR